MVALLRTRILRAQFVRALLMAGLLLGGIARAQASDSPAMNPSPQQKPERVRAVRRALREFDRFLDHHPLLEDDLRINTTLIADKTYLEKNPELGEFLGENPVVLQGLKLYPRYYLYRALLRQAGIPLRHSEIAQLKAVFDQQPTLELELDRNPELIRDPTFFAARPLLREFFTHHPLLTDAFLPQPTSLTKNP